MSKSAAKKVSIAKKVAVNSKSNNKASLKMVKSNAKPVQSKKSSSKKPVLKEVKKAAQKPAKKTASKSVAKPIAKKATVKPVAKAAPAKVVTKQIAKPMAVAYKQAAPMHKSAPAVDKSKMVARPISIASGFNKMPRPNGFVKKTYRTVDPKAPRAEFKIGSFVVYPTHGVGQIIEEEVQEIGGVKLKMFVISFVKDKMTLRVPMHRAHAAGLRHISSNNELKKMFDTLKAKARTSRGMWSRRAQEYESKINSGDVLLIAEVVRDLHQNVDQAERSYSERMIYESAFNRLAGELAASERTEFKIAGDKLLKFLRAKRAA